MLRSFRRPDNPNFFVGIFLLIVLAVFAGPSALPRLLSSFVPIADEGVPCVRLRSASERDRHQSLIGRSASTRVGIPPITLEVDPFSLPSDPAGDWVIRIVVTNDSIGTIPIVITEPAAVGIATQSGVGIVFNGAVPTNIQNINFSPTNLRLMGPRQRCVQRISIPFSQLGSLGINPTSTVTAYYQNGSAGTIVPTAGTVYSDGGVWTGVVTSEAVQVELSAGN